MGAGVVTLREGFEASLVVGIVLAFLDRTGRRDGFLAVWVGALAAVALSVLFAVGLFLVGAELEGTAEKVWEGSTMLAAAALLTWMVFWMRRQARTIRAELEGRVQAALASGSVLALALVAFVGVGREGLETALFLFSSTEGGKSALSVTAGLVGLGLAVALGYLFYRGSSRLDLRKFFTLTSGLLLVFAGYLLASGLHELAEAEIIPESEALLVAAFAALAAPTLWLYFRPRRRTSAT
ncbi:MAG TPA: FTR1 family protein [Gaiellaceae bacterium]|nr:FTR1 family protein [Gaiellaceae bacterium]